MDGWIWICTWAGKIWFWRMLHGATAIFLQVQQDHIKYVGSTDCDSRLVSWWRYFQRVVSWPVRCFSSVPIADQTDYVSPFLGAHRTGPSGEEENWKSLLLLTLKINLTHWGQGCHFVDIFKNISLDKKLNFYILVEISLKFVPKGLTDNKPALV